MTSSTARVNQRMELFLKECSEEGDRLRRKLPELRSVSRQGAVSPDRKVRSPSPTADHGQPRTGGAIDAFNSSVERALGLLPPQLPLDEKWRHLTAWMDRFSRDHMCSTLMSLSQRIAGELHRKTKDLPSPSMLRTTTACVVLEQLVHILTETLPDLAPHLDTMLRDITAAIFPVPPELPEATFSVLFDPEDARALRIQLDRFNTKPYYGVVRGLAAQSSKNASSFEDALRSKNKQMVVIDRTVEHWQKYTVQRLFTAWRAEAQNRRDADTLHDAIAHLKDDVAHEQSRVQTMLKKLEDAEDRRHADIADHEKKTKELLKQHQMTVSDLSALQRRYEVLVKENHGCNLEEFALIKMRLAESDKTIRSMLAQLDVGPSEKYIDAVQHYLIDDASRPDMLLMWPDRVMERSLVDSSFTNDPLDPYLKLAHILNQSGYTAAALRKDLEESDAMLKATVLLQRLSASQRCPLTALLTPADLAGSKEETHVPRLVLSMGMLSWFCSFEGCGAFTNPTSLVLTPQTGVHNTACQELQDFNLRKHRRTFLHALHLVGLEDLCRELLQRA
eukprot:PhM_4_TR11926/c0_g2_i1/m.23354